MAYMKTATAEEWINNINSIEKKCSDDLGNFLTKVNSASSNFEGNSADGLFANIKEFITTASSYTEQLKNLSTTLNTIKEVMEKQ